MQSEAEAERLRGALGDSSAECTRLHALQADQVAQLEEQTEKAEFMSSLQREIESTNRRNAQLETENSSLRWEACRCAAPRPLSLLTLPYHCQRCQHTVRASGPRPLTS